MDNLVHPQSCPATKTELDLWVVPPTQMAINKKYKVEYRPLAALSGEAPLIEFGIPASADTYYDLDETSLKVQMKATVYKTEGGAKTAVAVSAAGTRKLFSPINNMLNSMFQRVDLEMNGKLVTSTSQHYPYRCYLETLLNSDKQAQDTILEDSGWLKDTDFKVSEERAAIVEDDGSIDLLGKLSLDIFNQGRLLVGGMEMKLTLQAHRPSFYFITSDAKYTVEVEWTHVALFLTVAKLHSPVYSAQEKALAQNPAKYPITRVEVKHFTQGAQKLDLVCDNVFSGQLPRRMFMVLLDNAAENGSFITNPFEFKHFDVYDIKCWVNGELYPSTPMSPNFEKKLTKAEYQQLFYAVEQTPNRPKLTITPKEFRNGFTVFAWNFAPDYSDGCSTHWNLVRRGICRTHLRFSKALPSVVTILFFGEFDNVIEIDKDRNVATDF